MLEQHSISTSAAIEQIANSLGLDDLRASLQGSSPIAVQMSLEPMLPSSSSSSHKNAVDYGTKYYRCSFCSKFCTSEASLANHKSVCGEEYNLHEIKVQVSDEKKIKIPVQNSKEFKSRAPIMEGNSSSASTSNESSLGNTSQSVRRSARTPKTKTLFPSESFIDAFDYEDEDADDDMSDENNSEDSVILIQGQHSKEAATSNINVSSVTAGSTEFQMDTRDSVQFNPLDCRFCTQSFHRLDHRSIHEKQNHMPAVKPYKCKTCPRRFYFAEDNNFHEKLHSESWSNLDTNSNGAPPPQKINNIASPSNASDSSSNSFNCKFCPFNSKFKKGLHVHVGRIHKHNRNTKSAASFPVPASGLISTSNEIEKTPRKTSKSRPTPLPLKKKQLKTKKSTLFLCSLCDRGFASSTARKHHDMAVHTRNFPCKCTFCSKSFVCLGRLNSHSKRSKCAEKRRNFGSQDGRQNVKNDSGSSNNANNETKHEIINTTTVDREMLSRKRSTEGKKFTCNICERQLGSRAAFTLHSRVHTKPFKCQHCLKSFTKKMEALKCHCAIATLKEAK